MATVTLTGTIRKAPGAIAWANAPYKIRLVEGFVIIGGATRPPFTLSGAADALGAVSVSLDVPDSGTAHYELSIPGGPWTPAYLSAADTPTVEGWMAGAYDTPADVETVQALIDAAITGIEGATLSDAIPQPLGTAAAGDDAAASRGDHIHAMPTAAQVGAATAADIATHAADTTAVHGIADTSALVLTGDARLSDARTPTSHAATHVTGGGDVIASAVAGGNAGLMTGADKTKLDGVATGATANATDAQLRDRATHTGAQAIATVTGLQAALDAAATHAANTSNPHGITKAQVGLGSVENYAIASQAEAEAGSAANRYMTPQRVAQAIAALGGGGGTHWHYDANINVGLGENPLLALTSGIRNVAIGRYPAASNTSGSNNVAIGDSALYSNTTGASNVAVGSQALVNMNGVSDGTAVGYGAANANASGAGVTAVGYAAIAAATASDYLVGLGYRAGQYLSDGSTGNTGPVQATYLGAYTMAGAASATNEIVIGYNATGAGSNSATLGNASVALTVLRGAVELTEMAEPAAPGANKARLFVEDNGSGKSRLVVRFPSGVKQVIATEP